jgi:hypothetical protein
MPSLQVGEQKEFLPSLFFHTTCLPVLLLQLIVNLRRLPRFCNPIVRSCVLGLICMPARFLLPCGAVAGDLPPGGLLGCGDLTLRASATNTNGRCAYNALFLPGIEHYIATAGGCTAWCVRMAPRLCRRTCSAAYCCA